MKQLKSNKGFTLIELVVVIAILGILAGIAIPRFMDATATARGARIVADMRTIDSAAMLYNAKHGSVPENEAAFTTGGTSGASAAVLASWPTPPSGKAIITNNDGNQIELSATSRASYGYSATSGRAYLGAEANTVDAILKLKATTDI